tara:strand:+ start:11821 stop:15180 length:3360 start_codon:yes stop_codon:yes gene_type:complete
MSAFDRLIQQIDSFIRKYYKNEIIKGLILFIGVLLGSFLLVTFLEYIGRFNSYVRGVLFFGFIGVNLYIFGRYLLTSLIKLSSFGKRINRNQAASIIGSFFPQISDRLVNTLQLNETGNEGNFELIRASVVQRSNALGVFNFGDAIDLSSNRKHAKWLIPLFIILLGIAVIAPKILTQGTERVVNYNKEFVPEAPFKFLLQNNKLIIEEGEDAPVDVKIIGSAIPDKVYLVSEQGKFLMNWKTKNEAEYTLAKLSDNVSFYFEANGFKSEEFSINILPKSTIGKLEAKIHYPSYLGRKDEVVQNSGDLNVPEGTLIEWSFLTKNTKKVTVNDGSKSEIFTTDGFKLKRTIRNDLSLKVKLENKQSGKIDSTKMSIISIRDAFPSIIVKEVKDTVSDGLRFFSGNISDDYGLSALTFVYKVINKDGKTREERLSVLSPKGTDLPFDFGVDFRREKLQIEDRIEYYFVVGDNDGVNGSKTSRSQMFTYQLPTLEELNEDREKDQEQTKEDLAALLNKAKEFQKNVERLKKDVMNSKSIDWKAKNQLDKLKADQMELNKSLQNLQQNMEKSVQEKDQLSEMDPLLLEKQAQIEELMKELMDDEMMELLKKLEELMKAQNKDQIQNELNKLDQNAEDRNKQLDRSLEMLKKLQVNEKIDDIEKELKDLADEQRKLKDELEKDKLNSEKGKEKQDELNKKFEDIKDDLEQLKKLNDELERPMNLDEKKEDKEKITEEMKDASEGLDKNKKSKAGEKQQQSAEDLEKLAEDLNKMQEEANAEQEGEDIVMLRRILKNLMTLSFDQESVMKKFAKVIDSDPNYKLHGRKQRSIIDDTKMVRDSLEALAKRQPKIASFVDAELNEIKKNHSLSLEDIDEHRKNEMGQHQQYVMTSYNNLALLLNESLESMQKAARESKPGSGSCDKPGGKGKPKPGVGKPGMSDMKQMLKKQLEAMEKGKSPGGKKPGDSPGGQSPGGSEGDPMPGMGNKQISKMAAEQSAIRQRLEQLRDELNKEGKGQGNGLNPLINELDKQERDLLNKNFSSQLITRQKEILTRLLESEKALMERGFEEKRESQSGKDRGFGNQIRFEEYNKEKLKQVELMRSVDPVFRKYYKDKANQYFNLAM